MKFVLLHLKPEKILTGQGLQKDCALWMSFWTKYPDSSKGIQIANEVGKKDKPKKRFLIEVAELFGWYAYSLNL